MAHRHLTTPPARGSPPPPRSHPTLPPPRPPAERPAPPPPPTATATAAAAPIALSPAVISDPLPAAWRFDALGTPWRIDTEEPLPDGVRTTVVERIERFDRAWSRYRDDSLVSRIAREPGHHRLPD